MHSPRVSHLVAAKRVFAMLLIQLISVFVLRKGNLIFLLLIPFLTLTGLVIILIDVLLSDLLFSWLRIPSLGVLRNSLLFLEVLQRLSIVRLLQQLLSYFGFVSCFVILIFLETHLQYYGVIMLQLSNFSWSDETCRD